VPTIPTSFAGAVTTTSSGYVANNLAFNTPAAAHYVADLSLAQGALKVSDERATQTFASSGTFDLGVLKGGGPDVLSLTPQDGPQARWTLSIHALPVVLSSVAFDRDYVRPTQITKASYTFDGDVTLTATILNSANQAVRTLATKIAVAKGDHSLTWDGLDGSGSPVPDGSYTLAISYTDAAGNNGTGQASITVDATPPSVSVLSRSSMPQTHGLVVQVADKLSGLKSATLTVDGRAVQKLGVGESRFTFIPSGGWPAGTHSFTVSATDNAGNSTKTYGTFRVPVSGLIVRGNGRIGSFRVDVTTEAQIYALAGRPKRVSNDFAPTSAKTPIGRTLYYNCGRGCETDYSINLSTHRLSDYWSTSPRFVTQRGSHVGMSVAEAVRREGRRPIGGCALVVPLRSDHHHFFFLYISRGKIDGIGYLGPHSVYYEGLC
jgi:hypothetical protein